jgi:hypothetical protein
MMLIVLRIDYIDFTVAGGALIMAREDLPNADPEVDVILGQQVA